MPKSTFLPHNEREAKGMALAVGRALAWGAFTLIDPAKLKGSNHTAYWATGAGLGAVEMMAAPDDGYLTPRSKAALAVGTAALVFGTREWGTKTDAKITGWMRRVGIRNPRLWLAAFTAAGAFGAYLTERQPNPHDEDLVDLPDYDDIADDSLTDDVRGVVAKLLGAVDGYQREVLEAQLASARLIIEDPEWPLTLVVDETLPRTLLGEFTWPVDASFERNGRTHHVYLDVADGRLAVLGQYLDDELDAPADVDWSWPSADEITVVPGTTDFD